MNTNLKYTATVLAKCIGRGFQGLPDTALVEQMDLVERMRRQLDAMELMAIRELDRRDLFREEGIKSLPAWLRKHHRMPVKTGARKVKLAKALDGGLPAVSAALGAGRMSADQAWVIKEAMESLPETLDQQHKQEAETALVEQATQLDPAGLRAFGSGILHRIAPEVAKAHDRRRAADQHRDARERRRLRFTPDGKGGVRISALLDQQTATDVRTTLAQRAVPQPRRADEPPDERNAAQRNVDALAEICEFARAKDEAPNPGTDKPALVAFDYERAARDLGLGTVDTGNHLRPEVLRRIADDAHPEPSVPHLAGQTADLDEQRWTLTGRAWRAFAQVDGTCAAPDCSRPPAWCDLHARAAQTQRNGTIFGGGVLLPHSPTLSVARSAA